MNKINPLFEAMNTIDNNIVSDVIREKRKRPIALIIVAAAAISLLVGFTALGNTNHLFTTNNGERLYFNVYRNELTVPEEYFSEDKFLKVVKESKLPTELFEEFGAAILMNDNFSEKNGVSVYVERNTVSFGYYLHDKNINTDFAVGVFILTGDDYPVSGRFGFDEEHEYVKLNDGSDCYVGESVMMFAYNGIEYNFNLKDNSNDCPENIEIFKQVLADLGVL